MITVITGGSGSGKSEYAESVLLATKVAYQYYLATMEVFGEEDQKKVERHKKLREGKGFAAIERPRDLAGVDFQSPWEETAVLVECIGNLTANEFFAQGRAATREEEMLLEAKIVHGIGVLASQAKFLVIVTNEVSSDGEEYSAETTEYMRMLGRMNQKLFAMADRVEEVVCGIPVVLKGDET